MSRPRPSRHERLQVVFTFLVLFSGVMFLLRPDPTRAQVVFRLAVMLAGVIGLLWLNTRGRR
jgi:hypothetical protein